MKKYSGICFALMAIEGNKSDMNQEVILDEKIFYYDDLDWGRFYYIQSKCHFMG